MSECTVKEFINDARVRVGDTSCEISDREWIGYLNTALRRLAKEEDLWKLFEKRKTYGLAGVNTDGTNAASWSLDGNALDCGKSGGVIEITSLRILKQGSGCMVQITPCYTEYNDFFACNPIPEDNEPGDPCQYTVEEVGGSTKFLFDRPPKDPISIDITYSTFHPKITKTTDIIEIPYGYLDILEEYVIILYKMEADKFDQSRALYEDLDKVIDDARQLLLRSKRFKGYRRVRRSF